MLKFVTSALIMAALFNQAFAGDDIAPGYGVPGNPGVGRVVPAFVLDCASSDGTVMATPCGTANRPLVVQSTGTVLVSNLPATQPISATALPLPNGAATSANQPTINVDGGAQVHVQNALTVGSSTPAAIAPTASPAVESGRVFKSSTGTLYGFVGMNTSVAGYYLLFDAASVPADGPVTPKYCLKAVVDQTVGLNGAISFLVGISAAFSTTGCFTKTASATAMMTAQVQ